MGHQPLNEQPTVLRRGADEGFGVLGTAEVEVAILLPRHPQATVHLHCVACYLDESLAAVRPCHRCHLRQFRVVFARVCSAQCAAGGGDGPRDWNRHENGRRASAVPPSSSFLLAIMPGFGGRRRLAAANPQEATSAVPSAGKSWTGAGAAAGSTLALAFHEGSAAEQRA